ncbi:hypothetical protein O3P69_001884 [Scylla paramamosain]|uniref:Secreted protein n=1 Tax=Scylla paramamosain TaxID=85552 RepID=A0AAW0V0C1_SCYPA
MMPLLAVASVAEMQPEADMGAVAVAAAVACDFMERSRWGRTLNRPAPRQPKTAIYKPVSSGVGQQGKKTLQPRTKVWTAGVWVKGRTSRGLGQDVDRQGFRLRTPLPNQSHENTLPDRDIGNHCHPRQSPQVIAIRMTNLSLLPII